MGEPQAVSPQLHPCFKEEAYAHLQTISFSSLEGFAHFPKPPPVCTFLLVSALEHSGSAVLWISILRKGRLRVPFAFGTWLLFDILFWLPPLVAFLLPPPA